jgi:hypothetical protein
VPTPSGVAVRFAWPQTHRSAFGHLVDADKAKAADVRALATKPLTKREIAKTIRKALDE